jgi:hypothetical protein
MLRIFKVWRVGLVGMQGVVEVAVDRVVAPERSGGLPNFFQAERDCGLALDRRS